MFRYIVYWHYTIHVGYVLIGGGELQWGRGRGESLITASKHYITAIVQYQVIYNSFVSSNPNDIDVGHYGDDLSVRVPVHGGGLQPVPKVLH